MRRETGIPWSSSRWEDMGKWRQNGALQGEERINSRSYSGTGETLIAMRERFGENTIIYNIIRDLRPQCTLGKIDKTFE